MRNVKRFLGLVPAMLMMLVMSVMIWGFVFARITDAPPAQKIALYVDAPVPLDTELAIEMEKAAYPGIRMVKVHPFSYAMMGAEEIDRADLYILPEGNVAAYQGQFAPLPADFADAEKVFLAENVPYGLLAYDGQTGEGMAGEYITYALPGGELENYYLFFGKNSVHVPGNEGAADDAAIHFAKKLMMIP